MNLLQVVVGIMLISELQCIFSLDFNGYWADLQNENAVAVITAYTVLTMILTNGKWKISHRK